MSLRTAEDRAVPFDPATEEWPFARRQPPHSLEAQMTAFLPTYRHSIDGALGQEGVERAMEAIEQQNTNLLRAATHFDSALKDLDASGLLIGREDRQKLKGVREAIGEDFVKALLRYYDKVERQVMRVIEKLRERGPEYLLQGEGYNEEMARDVQRAYRLMIVGSRHYIPKILNPLSPDFAALKPPVHDVVPENSRHPDTQHYYAELQSIHRIVDLIFADADPALIKDAMFALTQEMLYHMQNDLASQVMTVIGWNSARQSRNIDFLNNSSALEKAEFFLDAIIRSLRVLGNIALQRSLLEENPAKEEVSQTDTA